MLLLINMDISELVPLTYSMLINNIDSDKQKKVKSEYTFLNLETGELKEITDLQSKIYKSDTFFNLFFNVYFNYYEKKAT